MYYRSELIRKLGERGWDSVTVRPLNSFRLGCGFSLMRFASLELTFPYPV